MSGFLRGLVIGIVSLVSAQLLGIETDMRLAILVALVVLVDRLLPE